MSSGNSWVGAGDGGVQHSRPPQARFDLRPLSTGEILDRTFQIYRSRFSLFAGVAMLPAGFSVVSQAFQLWYSAHQGAPAAHAGQLPKVQLLSGSVTFLSSILSLVLYGITQAATTWAVSAVYLGEPASIQSAYSVAGKHWFRYTLVVLRQVWAGFWLPFVLLVAGLSFQFGLRRSGSANAGILTGGILYFLAFVSLIYAVWAYIRVSLAIPAAVVESLKVRASIKRSKALLIDRKGRILLLFLFLFALYMVVGAMQTPLAFLALRSRGGQAFLTHAVSLALSFVTGTLVGPLGTIAICLFYIDERVRREGFDIEWMMTRLAPAPPPSAVPDALASSAPLEPGPAPL